MQLDPIDWSIILGTFAVTFGIGVFSARRASLGATEFFLQFIGLGDSADTGAHHNDPGHVALLAG